MRYTKNAIKIRNMKSRYGICTPASANDGQRRKKKPFKSSVATSYGESEEEGGGREDIMERRVATTMGRATVTIVRRKSKSKLQPRCISTENKKGQQYTLRGLVDV